MIGSRSSSGTRISRKQFLKVLFYELQQLLLPVDHISFLLRQPCKTATLKPYLVFFMVSGFRVQGSRFRV